MHLVYIVEHLLRIRIARSLKFVTSPLILGPVVPVLYNIIDRNMTLAELSKGALDLILSLVTLTTLPEAKYPLWIERSLTSECAIARDDLVEILACDEVVVHILGHLAPYAELLALSLVAWLRDTQTAISLTTIGAPLYAKLNTLALLQLGRELIGIGVPSCTPALRNNLLTIDIHLYIARIVQDELIELALSLTMAAALWFDKAFVSNVGTKEINILGEVLDTTIIGLEGNS